MSLTGQQVLEKILTRSTYDQSTNVHTVNPGVYIYIDEDEGEGAERVTSVEVLQDGRIKVRTTEEQMGQPREHNFSLYDLEQCYCPS